SISSSTVWRQQSRRPWLPKPIEVGLTCPLVFRVPPGFLAITRKDLRGKPYQPRGLSRFPSAGFGGFARAKTSFEKLSRIYSGARVRGMGLLMDSSPSELVRMADRVREGDRSALAALFDAYRERLHRMVDLRLDARLRSRLDPADVVQDAFLDAS